VTTPVLATKLFPPTPRSGVVARPRLADRLDRTLNPGHRLTLVSAPAGFGKTTLLSHWVQGHERVGWLSLDDGDNALPRFLAHLFAAFGNVGIDTATLDALAAAPTSTTMTAVVNELMRAGGPKPSEHWLLVLDDYHVVESPEVHEAMTFLLDHGPEQLHLLLATRADPPFPLPRLRSRGQLTEVRAADLRFASEEATQFFTDVMGLHLTEDDVLALEQRTEGWVAGLQLAALSLRDMPDPSDVDEFIGAFTGSNRFVIDYLVDEVLARQTDEMREFLLRTAILDRLTGPLCDAVTGASGGARMLESLDRGNLFVVPLDAERSWYRYHHLFGDVLRARLIAERPEELPALHRAASNWFASQHMAEDAVRHALAAGDHDRAGYLVESALTEIRRARQDHLLFGWARSLPEAVVRRSPVLSIMCAWSLMMAGDLDAMEHRLDDAEAALEAGARDPSLAATWADTDDLRTAPATLWVYRAALAQARGDVAGTVTHARHALGLAGADDHFVRGAASGFLGLAAWAAGDVREALATFSDAAHSLHAAGNLVDELDMTVVLGDMWVTAGRPHRARQLFEEALASATADGEPYPRATPDLHVGLAERDRELGDLDSAEAHLETARVLRERASITENRHRWYVAMAQVRLATGEHAAARQLLAEAESLYRPGSYPDLRPIAAMRARVHIAEGDLAAARAWADDHGVTTADDATFLREYDHLTLVRLRLAAYRRDAEAGDGTADATSLDDVLALLHRLQSDAGATRAGSMLEIGMLLALTHAARGHEPDALDALDHGLAQAPEPDGYVRLFLDEGAPILALLRAAAGSPAGARDALRGHAWRLLKAAEAAAGNGQRPCGVVPDDVPSAEAASLADPLSDRELDVLRLLDSDLTGPEMARQLFVSLNTLRTHTKRIYTKLDVTNRSAAVRRGRDLRLL
jgi:LuxR family maltose regulon positive regulatory protein